MNIKIKKTKNCFFMAIALIIFATNPVEAQTVTYSVDKTSFFDAQSIADWGFSVYSGNLETQGAVRGEVVTFANGIQSFNQYDDWSDSGFALLPDQTWMDIDLSFNELTEVLTIIFGDVYSFQDQEGGEAFPRSGSIAPLEISVPDATTTLWLAVNSTSSFDVLSTSTYDASINGEFIPELYAQGASFQGINLATDASWDMSLTLKMESLEGPPSSAYGPSESQLHIFGDNTVPRIPEPDSVIILSLAGTVLLLRRRRV